MSFVMGMIIGVVGVVFIEVVIAVITAETMDKGEKIDGDI